MAMSLRARDVHPERLGGLRFLAARDQVVAQLGARDEPGQRQHPDQHHQDDVVVGLLGREHEAREAGLEGRDLQAARPVELEGAEVVDVFDHDPDALGKGDRGQGEIGAAHLEGGQPDEHPHDAGEHRAHQHADPRADAVLQREDRRGVGPDPDEGRMPERQHAREAADQVPARGEIGVEVEQDQDVQIGRAPQHQRQGEGNYRGQNQGQLAGQGWAHEPPHSSPFMISPQAKSSPVVLDAEQARTASRTGPPGTGRRRSPRSRWRS